MLRTSHSPSSLWWAVGAALARLSSSAAAIAERRRQRRALAQLDEHLLRDIGVSRSAADAEIRKRFWER
jgi:uncharacterized protein YjiS (DUF1127 family)